MNVEDITALEFLAIAQRAARNSADKPSFKDLSHGLSRFPQTQQRLAFEFLALAWRSLKSKADPGELVAWASFFGKSVESKKLADYVFWLVQITSRSFEILGQLENASNGSRQFSLSIVLALRALYRIDPQRFFVVLDSLKSQCGKGEASPRSKVLARIERTASRREEDKA